MYQELSHIQKVLVNVLLITELAACIIGFLQWKKLKQSYWKLFPFYLAFINIAEWTGRLLKGAPQIFWFTLIVIPIEFLFFFWLFSKQPEFKGKKVLHQLFAGIYLFALLIEKVFMNEAKLWFTSFSYSIGNILLVVLIIRYLLAFINSDAILHYKKSMMFWVSIGLLIFYLGSFPFFALRNTLYANYRELFWIGQISQLALNCIMYLTFCLAFIWGKPK